jgi:hypothetical protein
LNGTDPSETQRAIHKMEVAVDEKLRPYKDNPIVSKLAEASKERFRDRILGIVSSRQNSSSKLGPPIETDEAEMNPLVQRKKRQRFEFMKMLYEVTNGNEHAFVNALEIGNELGFERSDILLTTQYLDGEGLLKQVTLDYRVGITHLGVVEVESALENPDRPTVHFPPAQNIIHIQTMTNSVIQQGVVDGSQSVSLTNEDNQLIRDFLEVVSKCLPSLPVTDADREQAHAEVETTKSQLSSPKPRPEIIKGSLQALLSILGKVSASVLTSDITSHLPAIEAFIRSLA